MNWYAFALIAWLVLGMELGLKSALALGQTSIAPSFVIPLATFVSLCAQPRQALVACLVLGLGLDLTGATDLAGGGTVTVVGPYALGLALGGQLVLAMRGVMMRQNPLTLVVLAILASMITQVIVVAIMTTRSFYDPIVWDTTAQIVHRTMGSLYTGVAALLMSLVLFPAAPVLGFGQTRHQIGRH